MIDFTNDEMNLMCIYNTGSRTGLIQALENMQQYISRVEKDLEQLTKSTLAKLNAMTDKEFEKLELYPDFNC